MKARYDISGMNCAACSSAVERAIKKLNIDEVNVNLLSGVMEVEYDENTVSDKEIRQAVTKIGFGIETAKSAAEKRTLIRDKAKIDERNLFSRLISSVILMLILMYFSMGHMLGFPIPAVFKTPIILAVFQFILTIPILIINRAYFINGTKHLFSGAPNMDSLIAVGSFASVIYGIFAIVQIFLGDTHYIHDLYFETAAMIPTLVTVGKYLEGKSKTGTGKALDLLIDLTPKKALLSKDGKEIEIEIESLKVGDTVIVKPGENFPCDGAILSGESYVDESGLTGESIPIYKAQGDFVSAGTINKSGTLLVSAEKVGDETIISGIVKLVENASGSKAPISRLADKISAYFVPAVIGISLTTFIIWMLTGAGFEFAFSRAICVLVISCPCALGLATPLAVTVGTGLCAQNGILIKSAEILEELGKASVVLFDKTGTLTMGSPKVTDIIPFGLSENEFLTLCASVEKMSEHPIGKAIVSDAEKRSLNTKTPQSFESLPGLGLCSVIDGKTIYGGNPNLFEKKGIKVDNNILSQYNNLCMMGKTPLFFSVDGEFIGCIAIADIPKTDSFITIKKLDDMGIKTIMLTGDNDITAKAIAKDIGIKDVASSLSPADKEKVVRKHKTAGEKVIMFGDGINDSPALAASDIGVSVSNGTDIALETSDCILMNSDVYSLVKAIEISKKTIKNIKISLFWALLYNCLGIPIAAGMLFPAFGIVLNPMIGAAAMSLSSVCVALNALRLKNINF